MLIYELFSGPIQCPPNHTADWQTSEGVQQVLNNLTRHYWGYRFAPILKLG